MNNEIKIKNEKDIEEKIFKNCPKNGNPIVKIKGKKGIFIMCSTDFESDKINEEVSVLGLYTPLEWKFEQPANHYVETADIEEYDFSRFCNSVEPENLIFTGKFDTR